MDHDDDDDDDDEDDGSQEKERKTLSPEARKQTRAFEGLKRNAKNSTERMQSHVNGDGHGNGDGRRQSHRNRAAASAKPPPNSHRPQNMFLLTFPAPVFFILP